MNRILPLFLGLTLFLNLSIPSFAQIAPPYGGALSSRVEGRVGNLYLSISGYASPFAFISLVINGVTLRTTIADENGVFYIPDVLIKSGLTSFCLVTVDFRHVGSSESCFNVPPVKISLDKKDILLPPTLALTKTEIAEGENTTAYGYTMPGAEVTLYLSNGQKYLLKADKNGYFRLELKGLKAGKYTIYATSKYKTFESSSPTKKLSVHVLNWWEQFLRFLKDLWDKFIKLFTSWSLGPLWLVIPILILIIILIVKLWKDKFTSILARILHFLFALIPRRRKLHHFWWVGY
ncbi:MAG TPA: hypothetical protein VES68_02295 [Candidatus Sulfotelmatobacter sp.]|nr:hypothetical protein [Candidatus Sulfotelmatobacter sp.]